MSTWFSLLWDFCLITSYKFNTRLCVYANIHAISAGLYEDGSGNKKAEIQTDYTPFSPWSLVMDPSTSSRILVWNPFSWPQYSWGETLRWSILNEVQGQSDVFSRRMQWHVPHWFWLLGWQIPVSLFALLKFSQLWGSTSDSLKYLAKSLKIGYAKFRQKRGRIYFTLCDDRIAAYINTISPSATPALLLLVIAL